ncbi:MAG: D-2-hydroxyacid dehydrogenase [Saprospiraceae bacterium]|nr:D-2-hydroxyacid dehydrogenase [Saprospiraceae bacterium]
MEIVFLDAFTNNPGDISFDAISSLGNLTVYDRTTLDQLTERTKSAEIVIVNKFSINEDTLSLMPVVKYIVVAATGVNNIDLNLVKSKNIPLSNVRGYSTESVTQHVFASIFTLLNRIEYYDAEVKKGRWSKSPDFCFYDHAIKEVSGLTLGIFGFGTIGSRVGEVAHAFGMNVIATTQNTSKDKPEYVHFIPIETLFADSDILTLHTPLTEDNKEIINQKNLKSMKKEALLINTARGGLVNERDLFYALDHGLIAGAALDVLQQEPPHYSNPLVNHVKCLVTPHIAWASTNARKKLLEGVAENIYAFQQGKVINGV